MRDGEKEKYNLSKQSKNSLSRKGWVLSNIILVVKLIFEGTVRVISSEIPLKRGGALIYDGTL